MNAKLQAITTKASTDLAGLIKDSEQKLLEAWNACEEEAQENETKPKFRIGFTITLDLDADSMESALTFGVRHKVSTSAQIPDPNQTEIAMEA